MAYAKINDMLGLALDLEASSLGLTIDQMNDVMTCRRSFQFKLTVLDHKYSFDKETLQ